VRAGSHERARPGPVSSRSQPEGQCAALTTDTTATWSAASAGTANVTGTCRAGYAPTNGQAPTRSCNYDTTWSATTNPCYRACPAPAPPRPARRNPDGARTSMPLAAPAAPGVARAGVRRVDVAERKLRRHRRWRDRHGHVPVRLPGVAGAAADVPALGRLVRPDRGLRPYVAHAPRRGWVARRLNGEQRAVGPPPPSRAVLPERGRAVWRDVAEHDRGRPDGAGRVLPARLVGLHRPPVQPGRHVGVDGHRQLHAYVGCWPEARDGLPDARSREARTRAHAAELFCPNVVESDANWPQTAAAGSAVNVTGECATGYGGAPTRLCSVTATWGAVSGSCQRTTTSANPPCLQLPGSRVCARAISGCPVSAPQCRNARGSSTTTAPRGRRRRSASRRPACA